MVAPSSLCGDGDWSARRVLLLPARGVNLPLCCQISTHVIGRLCARLSLKRRVSCAKSSLVAEESYTTLLA